MQMEYKQRFQSIIRAHPELGPPRFTLHDFMVAHVYVVSRVFGLSIDGEHMSVLVPLAEAFNHQPRGVGDGPATNWTFDEKLKAFTSRSARLIPAYVSYILRLFPSLSLIRHLHCAVSYRSGAEVTASFGVKCNSRWLLTYGFALEDNDQHNASDLLFSVPSAAVKKRLVDKGLIGPNDLKVQFEVKPYGAMQDQETQSMFAFARMIVATDE